MLALQKSRQFKAMSILANCSFLSLLFMWTGCVGGGEESVPSIVLDDGAADSWDMNYNVEIDAQQTQQVELSFPDELAAVSMSVDSTVTGVFQLHDGLADHDIVITGTTPGDTGEVPIFGGSGYVHILNDSNTTGTFTINIVYRGIKCALVDGVSEDTEGYDDEDLCEVLQQREEEAVANSSPVYSG